MLSFYNHDMQRLLETGEFRVFIGGNSNELQEKSFTLSD
jgi:hypothetical protein